MNYSMFSIKKNKKKCSFASLCVNNNYEVIRSLCYLISSTDNTRDLKEIYFCTKIISLSSTHAKHFASCMHFASCHVCKN